MKKIIIVIGIIAIVIYGFNYLTLQMPANKITNQDIRNEGIKFDVHYNYYIVPTTLTYNLKTIPSDKAPADVFRVFLQTSSALKDKNFNYIELAFKGKTKFIIKGDYYSQIGQEFGEQNPVYTIRTFPEHLFNVNEESAYPEWSGGVFGVLGKQMEDFNDFTSKWFMDDLKAESAH